MAWSYRSKRTYSRSARRSFRRRRLARPRYSRRYRRRYVSRKSTKSAVVKLTATVSHTFGSSSTGPWNPFLFTPLALNGFIDYYATYSHFRILKVKLHIPRDVGVEPGATASGSNSDTDTNYLVVGSRPYAATTLPNPQGEYNPLRYVPIQTTEALRQSRWQKVIYPNATRTKITIGFYPYTMIATFGPMWSNLESGAQYQRIWESRRWMPFTWATGGSSQLPFFGPYIVHTPNFPQDAMYSTGVTLTMEVWLQFKGQK